MKLQAVSTWAKNGNEKFLQALEDPLYVRIREALISGKKDTAVVKSKPSFSDSEQRVVLEGNLKREDSENDTHQVIADDGKPIDFFPDMPVVRPSTPPVMDWKSTTEIEEMSEASVSLSEENDRNALHPLDDQPKEVQTSNQKNVLKPEVTEALNTLNKVIQMVRELGINSRMNPLHVISSENSTNTDKTAEEDNSKDEELSLKDLVLKDKSKEVTWKLASSDSRRSSSIGSSR